MTPLRKNQPSCSFFFFLFVIFFFSFFFSFLFPSSLFLKKKQNKTKCVFRFYSTSDLEHGKIKAETEAKQANENAERLKAEKLALVGEIDSLKARLKDQQQQLATANQGHQDLMVSMDRLKVEHEALSTEVSNSQTKHRKTRKIPFFFFFLFCIFRFTH